jgi:hypothetical protein
MFIAPPPTKHHWVYDDPSGVGDHYRPQVRKPRTPIRRPLRVVHQES